MTDVLTGAAAVSTDTETTADTRSRRLPTGPTIRGTAFRPADRALAPRAVAGWQDGMVRLCPLGIVQICATNKGTLRAQGSSVCVGGHVI